MKKVFTPSELEYIRKNYPDTVTKIIAKKFNCSLSAIYRNAHSMGLYKSEAFKNSPESQILRRNNEIGKRYQFKKGHVPINKGQQMDPSVRERVKHTFIQKGLTPHNTLHDGAITTRTNRKSKRQYKWIRIDGKWEMLHVVEWVKANGVVPKGHIIVFKDRNSLNVDLKNLECITFKENMLRNTIHNLPEELKEVIHLQTRIKKKTKKLTQNG